MSIRNMTAADLDRVVSLFDGLREAAQESGEPMASATEPMALRLAARPEGAFVEEESGRIKGAVLTTLWGRTGWIGPIGVDPSDQGLGLGTRLLEEALGSLQGAGATVIGTELPVADNRSSGFLLRRGFRPHAPTLVLESGLGEGVPDDTPEPIHYSSLMEERRDEFCDQVRSLSASMDADLDYSEEVKRVDETRVGESLLLRQGEEPVGLAICHTRSYLREGEPDIVRVPILCLNESSPHPTLDPLLGVIQVLAREVRARRIRIPVPSRCWEAVRYLIDRGYRVAGVRQRMTLMGYPDRSDASRINLARWG